MVLAILIILVVLGAVNLALELKRDLMMLQQNSYRNERYSKWLTTSGDTTSFVRMVSYAGILVMLMPRIIFPLNVVLPYFVYILNSWTLLRAKYKKPLVWTNRAKRIYGVAVALSVVVLAAVAVIYKSLYAVAVAEFFLYALSHVVTLFSNWLLKPVEKHINQKYYDDARRIIESMSDLKVIGITGSYGKTSTKHYLNRILQEKYNVLMTPGSYNTLMGVIRTVREMMKPYDEIFICEMGAKNIGDIKEICDLVHPSIGIITAVGEQHLESFKTIENVQRTKFELVDALPKDGMAFLNDDFAYVANRPVDSAEAVRYAMTEKGANSYYVKNLRYAEDGTDFTLVGPFGEADFHTRLIGEFNISNLIPAIAVAIYLDVPMQSIKLAVSKIEQVEHRLSVKRTPGGITIIDDAFNSNPDGSRMALEVLREMKKGQRIIVTPGMIELGEKQWEYNNRFGKKIAGCADVAIIVGAYNRDAILEGLKEGEMPESKVVAVDTFADAQRYLSSIMKAGDTVLYENDLPDTFK